MKEYLSRQQLRELIDENNRMILVLSRFGIPFGFGNSTVAEVCRENDVDIPTFLAVANLISGKESATKHKVNLPQLINYLRKTHEYFLNFSLPAIRRKLIDAINRTELNDVAFLVLKYFDDYVSEVRRHLENENDVVFPYVTALTAGERDEEFKISDYSSHHTDMGDKLNELKDIVIHHFRQGDNDLLNSVLYDIISCQDDLDSHCMIENNLLVPAVIEFEKTHKFPDSEEEQESPEEESQVMQLSEREKEVIRGVAKGQSNKEIADELCLSVHTVTTYRRNIASKLQIHSPAGLTIFAIMNKLIDLKEIKL